MRRRWRAVPVSCGACVCVCPVSATVSGIGTGCVATGLACVSRVALRPAVRCECADLAPARCVRTALAMNEWRILCAVKNLKVALSGSGGGGGALDVRRD